MDESHIQDAAEEGPNENGEQRSEAAEGAAWRSGPRHRDDSLRKIWEKMEWIAKMKRN